MQLIYGASADEGARMAQLETAIGAVVGEKLPGHCRYLHLVDLVDGAEKASTELTALLSYGSEYEGPSGEPSFIVLPRIGTISPWSSKATDIATTASMKEVVRLERAVAYYLAPSLSAESLTEIGSMMSDRMCESVVLSTADLAAVFTEHKPAPLVSVSGWDSPTKALTAANKAMGLSLSADEIEYLIAAYGELGRPPTDAELMMFSVVNSEHCRHKVFNAKWSSGGRVFDRSLFQMIKSTLAEGDQSILSAFFDNAAVVRGLDGSFFYPGVDGVYKGKSGRVDLVIKAETHNYPTAIEPYAGAGTGAGGEIRDEGATGRGASPVAGFTGFVTSPLQIPSHELDWEPDLGKPNHYASPLEIMINGPLGAAAFNNEFGRPALAGYFRVLGQTDPQRTWGYNKPIMLAGGLAHTDSETAIKNPLTSGNKLIVLGGPAMRIGMAGAAASSVAGGGADIELDFAAVQRQNPEMQRRAQEVINACYKLGADANPVVSIHDVGAGGVSNALSELVNDSGLGAQIELRSIPNAEPGMSPREIWVNESQERYVLAIHPEDLGRFGAICARERCPWAVVGEATTQATLLVTDSLFENNVVDVANVTMFGKPPKLELSFESVETPYYNKPVVDVPVGSAITKVLTHPAVGSKSFLITIGDRTVGGMTHRDQMVGPWQVPVADAAVTHNSFDGCSGHVLAIGERPPVAVVDPIASGRLAVAEAVTNALCADVADISDLKLSANWMVAAGQDDQRKALYETVVDLTTDFLPSVGLTICVGKDSTSMETGWVQDGQDNSVVSPLSLNVSAFAAVDDVRKTLSPYIGEVEQPVALYVPVDADQSKLGGSIYEAVHTHATSEPPTVSASGLTKFFAEVAALKSRLKVCGYHDVSDGGLVTSLLEISFANRLGFDLMVPQEHEPITFLFSENPGAIIVVERADLAEAEELLTNSIQVATFNEGDSIEISHGSTQLESTTVSAAQRTWSQTSYQISRLRDNPVCADQEFEMLGADRKPMSFKVVASPRSRTKPDTNAPRVAILREQGVNGHVEMAAAFYGAGFNAVDVHMTDLMSGSVDLSSFVGLACPGGFSFGDVLGAGNGWASSVMCDARLRGLFSDFFEREDSFSIGVCNGCQMLSHLAPLIPGAEGFGEFQRNTSGRFEARLVTVEVMESPSVFLNPLAGSILPVAVAHGEGRIGSVVEESAIVVARYVDNNRRPTERYPHNPNGSVGGVTGFTSTDGRATILMPHPERSFRTSQLSYHPPDWGEESPWMTMFQSAYDWVHDG